MKEDGLICKLWRSRWVLRSLPWSVRFNFRYLPWRQAVRLPILLYKPKLLKMGGVVRIDSENIRTGMIRLGTYTVSIYPNSGFTWECEGQVVFEGDCLIGNSSAMSVSSTGSVRFGGGFHASAALRLVSYREVRFGRDVHIGWDCIVTDTDLHKMVSRGGGKQGKGYGAVEIGCGTWIAMRCTVLKNTRTPECCTVSAGSVLSGSYMALPSHSVIGPDAKIILKREGYYRDYLNDGINYV